LFSNIELPHSENGFSHLGPYFDDPNGQKLRLGVVNLPLKLFSDPTVNEFGMEVLMEPLHGKRELFSTHILSLSSSLFSSLRQMKTLLMTLTLFITLLDTGTGSTEHHKDTKHGHYQAWMLFEVNEFKLIVNV
jgi:hypothetical protein